MGPARFFATASRGTEEVLARELRALGVADAREDRGGVAFGACLEDAYRACLWSRVASRVLMPLAKFRAPDADALYAGVHAIDWTDHVGPERTLAVAVAGSDAPAGPPHFVALKAKDAIVDRVRSSEGARPSIDKRRPDVRIHVHVREDRVTVSLDLAGRGLHRRGVGREGAEAPLRENLAAAMLWLAGWPQRAAEAPFLDPMCGSGTLLSEAAAMALDVAPGLGRDGVGLEGWRGHDAGLWKRLRDEAAHRRRAAHDRVVRVAGFDASPGAVRQARTTMTRAGLAGVVRVDRRELREAAPPWSEPGLIITNPPYGARLGEAGELGPLYELLGDVLRRRFPGWSAWVLTGNPALAKRIGLRPASRTVLFNGPIECRLLEIPIADAPVASKRGPGWRRAGDEARGFARRLRANLRERRRMARDEGLSCYRVYDSDHPLYNLAVDWYDGAVRVEEYEAPAKVAPEDAERRLRDALAVLADVLEVDPAAIVLRVRRRLGPREQHARHGDRGRFHEVREGDLRFRVNLTDYLDTGLFLDDRLLRRRIRELAAGRDFLNLFAYTCTASVAAAAGGARSTTSVDLSRRYLDWGRENLRLNGFAGPAHRLVRADALRWIERGGDHRRYDLIFLAPPTRSRSKGMAGDFEVQRDHAGLLDRSARLLSTGGTMIFATNLRSFEPDFRGLDRLAAREATVDVTPPDFARRPRLRAWILRHPG